MQELTHCILYRYDQSLGMNMQYKIQTIDQLKPLLQGFRRKAGFTQAAMAEKLGVSQQNYAQLESNLGSASVDRLYKVLRLLNVQLIFDERESTSEDSELTTLPREITSSRNSDKKNTSPVKRGPLASSPKRLSTLSSSKRAPLKLVKRNDTTKW